MVRHVLGNSYFPKVSTVHVRYTRPSASLYARDRFFFLVPIQRELRSQNLSTVHVPTGVLYIAYGTCVISVCVPALLGVFLYMSVPGTCRSDCRLRVNEIHRGKGFLESAVTNKCCLFRQKSSLQKRVAGGCRRPQESARRAVCCVSSLPW